jgi:hypothetical protein
MDHESPARPRERRESVECREQEARMLAFLALLLNLTQPVQWTHFDTGELKGRPARLAWSEDRSELERGKPPRGIDSEPKWVAPYWKWKSAKSFFGDRLMTITIDVQKRMLDNLNGTAANKAVYLDPYVSGQALLLSKQSGGTEVVNRLVLNNKVIGQFVDEQIVPGYTFSWSPEEFRLIAFRSPNGRLMIMNGEGETQDVSTTADVLLPAWSDDGQEIAYLERTGRKTFTVMVVSPR